MTLSPGQLRAPVLRDALPSVGFLPSAAVVFGSEVSVEASGLAVGLEPQSYYAIDGYIAFHGTAVADIKIGFTAPAGATGHWGMFGALASGVTSAATQFRQDGFGDAFLVSMSADGIVVACLPFGYIATVPGGALRVQFAQHLSEASEVSIREGSWLRLSKLA